MWSGLEKNHALSCDSNGLSKLPGSPVMTCGAFTKKNSASRLSNFLRAPLFSLNINSFCLYPCKQRIFNFAIFLTEHVVRVYGANPEHKPDVSRGQLQNQQNKMASTRPSRSGERRGKKQQKKPFKETNRPTRPEEEAGLLSSGAEDSSELTAREIDPEQAQETIQRLQRKYFVSNTS